MTAWRKYQRSPAKFGNEVVTAKCAYDYSHRSKLEASVCNIIALRERAGELVHLGHEVHVCICGPIGHVCGSRSKIQYVADFRCKYAASGEELLIEAKGFESETWRLKRRLYMHHGAHPLEIWGGSWQNPSLTETIIPHGSAA